jgi:ABC-type nitrate/sulfonate/bicarbonate transport system substrate-binding protein
MNPDMTHPHKLRLTAIGMSLIIATAACTSPQKSAGPDTFKLCYAYPGATSGVAHYATHAGIFAQHGLVVEETLVRGTTNAAGALISGEFDACSTQADVILAATLSGSDLAYFLSFFNRNQAVLMADAAVRGPADLAGKTIVTQLFGSPNDRLTRLYLAKYGVAEDQVTFSEQTAATYSERLAIVLSGNASALLVPTIMDAAIAESKGLKTLVGPKEAGAKDKMASAIAASRKRMAEKRDVYERFVLAMHEAAVKMRTDEAGVVASMAEFLKMDAQKDADVLQAGSRALLGEYLDVVPYPSVEAIEAEMDALAKKRPEIRDRKPQDFIDVAVLDALVASGRVRK